MHAQEAASNLEHKNLGIRDAESTLRNFRAPPHNLLRHAIGITRSRETLDEFQQNKTKTREG
jgi:hypothetical protein